MANLQLKESIIQRMMKTRKCSHEVAEKEFTKLTKNIPEKEWGKVVGGGAEAPTKLTLN